MRFVRPLLTIVLALCLIGVSIAPLNSLNAQGSSVTLMLTIPTVLAELYSPKFLGEFEASHPGIKVQVNKQNPAIPAPATDLDKHFEGVQKYVTTGDVVFVSVGTIYAEDTYAGYFLDLTPLVKEDKNLNPDDFYPTMWQSYQWDNGIWALPVSGDPFLLLYNPDAFDKAAIPYPSDKWTVDDLIEAVRKLTTKDATGTVKPGIDVLPFIQAYAFRAMMKTPIVNTDTVPNTPRFDTPELTSLMEKWLKLDNEGAVGGEISKAPISIAPALWLALKDSYYPGEKRSAAMLPGGQAAISVDGFAVSGGTQYPEQAYALASWLTTRAESSNKGLSSTSARKSLKNAAASDQLAFKLDVPPEVQAIIDLSVEKATPLSEMRFADYLAMAYNKMKNDKVDVTVALQTAEGDAIKAQQQAANQKEKLKNALVVATPMPAGNAAGAGKIKLKFAISNVAPMIPNKDAWDKLIADFTASDPNVASITLDVSTNQLEKLATDHDCFYLPYNGLAPEKLARLVPLDPFTSADTSFDKADMVPGVLAQLTRDNKLYALPSDLAPEVLKYDSAAFEKAGVPAPASTWTTDQFADALKQLKTYNSDKPAFVPVNTFGVYIMNLIVAYGGLPIDYRTNPPTVSFTDPATVDAIRQVTNLAKDGYFKYHALFGSQLDLVLAPEPSLIKSASLGAYSLGSLLGGGGSDKLKLALYPRGSKYAAVSYNVGALYISATTQNPEACYRWISAVARNPNLFGSMPARRSMIADPALVTAQGADVVAVYKQIADMMQDPNTISLPAYSGGSSLNDLMMQLELYKALDKYMAEGSSVELESVLKDAETSAQGFQGCAGSIPPLDMTSTDSQKAYFNAAKQCAAKADPDLAPFFAGVKTD